MTVVVYVLAGIGATTLLAAVALIGAGWRSCRPIDAQTPAPVRVYDWACEGDCPDCNPDEVPPVNRVNVHLWQREIWLADENEIMREASR